MFSMLFDVLLGASAGIGQGIAVHFASLGSKLVLTGRSQEKLEETRQLCSKTGTSADKVTAIYFLVYIYFGKRKVHNVYKIMCFALQ